MKPLGLRLKSVFIFKPVQQCASGVCLLMSKERKERNFCVFQSRLTFRLFLISHDLVRIPLHVLKPDRVFPLAAGDSCVTKPAGEGFLMHKMEDVPFYVERERPDSEAQVLVV